jgi:hypothetical protein
MKTLPLILAAAALLAGCLTQESIEGTRAEPMTVDGRKLKVNVGPTGTPGEFRLLVVRDTMVIDPDPALERRRAQEASRRVMASTCKDKPPRVLNEGLSQEINYYVLFRCGA